jgi:hypothetical protein
MEPSTPFAGRGGKAMSVSEAARGVVEEPMESTELASGTNGSTWSQMPRMSKRPGADESERSVGDRGQLRDGLTRLGDDNANLEKRDRVTLIRAAVDHLVGAGQLVAWGTPVTGVLVETLLDHGGESDVVEAEAAIDRLAAAPADDRLVIREIWLLRLRALLARAHSDETNYRDYRDRYRAMATSLCFEGHMAMAEAMPWLRRVI